MDELLLFIRALALALAFEGIIWALFPGRMRALLLRMLNEPDSSLRGMGATAIVFAALLAWIATII